MRRTLHALAVVALLLTSASCGGDNRTAAPDGPTVPTAVRPDTTSTFGWADFGGEDDDDNGTVQTGSLTVPIDYDNPSAGTFDIYIARHLATDPEHRIGSLLVNPGGPGYGGSDWAIYAAQNYGKDLLAHFDIVGWDPRGTGLSTPPIDCIDDYDQYFASSDITPDDATERQANIDLAQQFEGACIARSGAIVDHIETNQSARDMDTIRAALGEPKISYFGFSYGSELGATWMTMFPDTVRAAVLDGAVDPNADLAAAAVDQAAGFANTFNSFLARCSKDDDCSFHNDGDAEGAYDALMTSLDQHPIPTEPGRPAANLEVLVAAASAAMYSQQLWPSLEQALTDAQAGDGRGLLALYDEYYLRNDDGT
ncbi:MAG: hypothetical protein JWN99_181, partial [Ilumatobacteraceae bacterium]|nr:hypothetical protein [Ilumatobacteraceae bacterium]